MLIKNLFLGFLIEIWHSLLQSFSHRLLKVNFSGLISFWSFHSQQSWYGDSALPRYIFSNNTALSEDLASVKSTFLTPRALSGALTPAILNLLAISLSSTVNFLVLSSSPHHPRNFTQRFSSAFPLVSSFISRNISRTINVLETIWLAGFVNFRLFGLQT